MGALKIKWLIYVKHLAYYLAHNKPSANVFAILYNREIEGPSLRVWRCVPHLPKKILSVFAGLFLQSEPPSANRKPSSDVSVSFPPLFVLVLLLPWLLTGNIPRKTSRDWLPLCFRAADRVCVLLTAAVLPPPWGPWKACISGRWE